MRTPKVRLYIRVRLPDGRHAYRDPVWNRNRTLRAGYAVMDGQPESHPEGMYYLRFLRGRKRIREAVGSNADAAIAELRNRELDLQSTSPGRSTPGPPFSLAPGLAPSSAPAFPVEVSLSAAIDTYVSKLGLFRAKKTVREAKRILELFGKRFSGKAIQAITRQDLLDHMASLQEDGLGLRTISNHITRIGALLRRHKIVDLLSNDDKPKYDEREVEAYDSDQLTALFAAASPE